MTPITLATATSRSNKAQGDQIRYNQNATDNHGQSDGVWRADCSGLVCAVFDLKTGIGCPSTYELKHSDMTSAPLSSRSQAVPYKSITLVTNEDGFPFGHVAIVVGYNKSTDQLKIQEHGGGVGPDIRWLPSGVNYDSDARYGRHRSFQLYNMTNVTGTAPAPTPPRPPAKPGKGTAFPLPGGHYFGDINGPNESHGGDPKYDSKQVIANIAAIQRIVGRPATGRYDAATVAAVKHWQQAHHVAGSNTGKVGPLTWKAMGL